MRKALLAIALTCLSVTAYAQVGSSSGLRIQFKNQGTAIGTFTNWLPINCSTGMSCSFSGGIVTMTATGGGALTPPITISDTAANTDLSLINTTAALVGAAQSSPIFDLQGKYWSGASSADDWTIKSVLSNGLNGTSTLTIGHTGSTSQAVSIGASVSGTSFTAVAAGTHSWTGRSALFSPADGKVELLNNAGTAFTSLQFGGITSSFPEIKVNGTALNFRLADDSADAAITASGATLSGLSDGIVRSGSGALSGAELSGDATTSGSNAVTVVKANGNTFPASVALGDTLYGSGASAISKLAGPTATNSVPQYMMETPSGGLAIAPAWSTLPVPYNAQTGTTYTIAATDRSSYVSTSNGSAIAVTLPQANTTGFANKFSFWIRNIGAGNLTITPTTSTIDGNATKTVAQGGACFITSDDTNYFTICDSGVVTTGSPLSKTVSVSGVQINCTTCVNDPGTAVDSTVLGADVTATTALATGASGAGVYRISVWIAVTRAGTTSTMPTTCITWTERNSSQAMNLNTTASSTGNALTTFAQAELVVNAKASTNIQYATGANCTGGTTYASTGGTSMQYDLSVRVTALP